MEKSDISKLIETQKILNDEFSNMKNISITLDSTSNTFKRIDSTYGTFGSQVSKSRAFLKELKQRLDYQDIIFYLCFYFFLLTCAWLFLKRFGVNLILTYIIELISSLFSSLLSSITGEL